MGDARLATRPLPEGVEAYATWGGPLRQDGTHRDRYLLVWNDPLRYGPQNLVIAMNPSGASEDDADLTLLKVWEFCRRWNDGSLVMANVNPFRATNPREMEFHVPALAVNCAIIRGEMAKVHAAGGLVVAAWGNPPRLNPIDEERFDHYTRLIRLGARSLGVQIMCLGMTKDGDPRHPSRIAYDTPLVPWRPR